MRNNISIVRLAIAVAVVLLLVGCTSNHSKLSKKDISIWKEKQTELINENTTGLKSKIFSYRAKCQNFAERMCGPEGIAAMPQGPEILKLTSQRIFEESVIDDHTLRCFYRNYAKAYFKECSKTTYLLKINCPEINNDEITYLIYKDALIDTAAENSAESVISTLCKNAIKGNVIVYLCASLFGATQKYIGNSLEAELEESASRALTRIAEQSAAELKNQLLKDLDKRCKAAGL